MKKVNRKSKALRKKTENNVFGALLFGLLTCAVSRVVLALVFALIMAGQKDSSFIGGIVSPVITVVSLVLGGYAAGKTDRKSPVFSSLLLGLIILLLSYLLSTWFDLTKDMNVAVKSVIMAASLVCPVVGARFASKTKEKGRHRRKM